MDDTKVRRIYLDYNASTPIAPEVAALMHASMDSAFGNPSSLHWAGIPARELVDKARAQVASLLGCQAHEIVFTSGGSEANNHALTGVYFANLPAQAHIITTSVEHPAIVEVCNFLQKLGARISWLPVDSSGRVDPQDLRKTISDETVLITIMHANNEVGTIQPIEECAQIAREHSIIFHTDAAQSIGKIPVRVDDLGVDLLSVVGHKIHAPKGIGALYIRDGLTLEPFMHGAGHESGRRAGTESAMLAAALGAACERAEKLPDVVQIQALRDHFWQQLQQRFGNRVALNGHPQHRLPNTLNVSFVGQVGAELLAKLDGVAASTGSACHAGRIELSPVLKAMNIAPQVGMGALRFSLGDANTQDEIDCVVDLLEAALPRT